MLAIFITRERDSGFGADRFPVTPTIPRLPAVLGTANGVHLLKIALGVQNWALAAANRPSEPSILTCSAELCGFKGDGGRVHFSQHRLIPNLGGGRRSGGICVCYSPQVGPVDGQHRRLNLIQKEC